MSAFALDLISPVRAWRLDEAIHAATWSSGIGAQRAGGRWNPKGIAAVYCSLDPATAILEVAVHKGFYALDTKQHVLTAIEIADPASIFIVHASTIPNETWLRPGTPGAGQQEFGRALLAKHTFIAIPSAVSKHSWNLIFDAAAAGKFKQVLQEPLALDTRLNPPKP